MSQEEIETNIKYIESKIRELHQEISELESRNELLNNELEVLEDKYRIMIHRLRQNILNYENLSSFTKKSYYNVIFPLKKQELDYEEKYIKTSERFRGNKHVHYSAYLRLTVKKYDLFKNRRNQIVHHHPDSDLSVPEFLNMAVTTEYEEMYSNIDKTINSIKTELEDLGNNTEDYKRSKDLYEILGDLFVHKVLLRKEKQILLKETTNESYIQQADDAKKAFDFYNKAIDFGRKLEDVDIRYLTYRADDYLEIFKDFMFIDKLGNIKEITDLKEKRDYIEEKFRIWEKYTKKKFNTNPLKGMQDFYPEDLREVNWILSIIKDIAERYDYDEFETPLLEPIEIFAAKSSHELVYNQSFYVERFEDRKTILRPELTPSLARMVARKSQELKKPIRWFSIPTCFRYEQPQRGRLRSFKQPNVDILGEESLYADLEIFNIVVDIFTEFGATAEQFQIYYNSRRFMDAICKFVLEIDKEKMPLVYKVIDKSDKMSEDEFEKYLIDTFQDEIIIEGIFKLKEAKIFDELLGKFDNIPDEFYKSDGYLEITNFTRLLKEANLSNYCTFSSGTVRGLDYYTGIIYEVFDTGKENIRSIFGGGRYDDLLSIFSDEKITGTGFGMGVYTLSLFLKTYNLIPDDIKEKDYSDTIYIASINEDMSTYAFEIARIIRDEDFPCIIDYRFKNLKNQLSKANELGVIIVLIIGPEELAERTVTIRNMVSEEQKTIELDELLEEIYDIIDQIGNNKFDQ